ncbi:hypothetical protein Spb1_31140 [Planctopirus ephydatiae]|jgi:hypothetical protein|uniref:Uncharacterized protein n=1 Tax=Planctopirus ephydatiae TaxID=2528019 RepID=A0A518GRF6_9PLAN|nr:hypothetical protein [Planctopirus ephydatiae]QDV31176.1 hypothetical protein Spb1_31140 [Planctopirus ephydatiae]
MLTRPWMIWSVPALAWGCFMCWAAGYQAGFDEGQDAAWATARKSLNAVASADAPHPSLIEERFSLR